MAHRSSIVTLIAVFTVGLLVACGTDRAPCEGTDAECSCDVDEDCTITLFHSAVDTEASCYDLVACCPGDGLPLNVDQATANEADYDDAACIDGFDSSACDDCEAGASAWVECVSGSCVKFYTPAPTPQHNY